MKKLYIIATLLVTAITTAQTNYEQGMQKAFELWRQNNPIEASNLFERIAKAEPDNWLPSYYVAQINILYSFGERNEEKLSAQLKKAQNFINDATAISKNNPEILVLQALLHTAWVAYDGATYGMTLSGKIVELYTKAEMIAPENPRVVYCKAEWNIGGAKYFGQDTKPFCKDLERAKELFANFKPETPFSPNWGNDRVELLLKDCK
ncbi:tetratricopeptide repeat protein [Mariniflexile jejuense]|uniref:Tetratricopeptide repeat protein n=1 Tax=Mariniflexile jejuense TaxID=1173582 RepID=A0ABW3JMH3_9FLAO